MRTYDDKMFIETFEHQYTWLNGFMRNVRRYGKKAALLDPATDRSWTYTQLNQEANQLAHALRQDGVGKNDGHVSAAELPGILLCIYRTEEDRCDHQPGKLQAFLWGAGAAHRSQLPEGDPVRCGCSGYGDKGC